MTENDPNKNTVQLKGHIIEVSLVPAQHEADFVQLKKDIQRLSAGKSYDVLVDLRRVQARDSTTKDVADTFFEDLNFRRYAVFGGTPAIGLRTKNVLERIADPNRIKFFRHEEDAREWLGAKKKSAQTDLGYSIRVQDDLIYIDAYRNWSVEEVQAVRKEVEAILAKKNGPKDILASVGDFGAPEKDAMKEAIAFFRETPFGRMAAFGTKPARIVATNLVMRAAGNSDRFKIFRDEEDARAWLQG